ncbi:MAG: hypothetical protein QM704_16170 [Anaeromyxobacteraceae bacterium]
MTTMEPSSRFASIVGGLLLGGFGGLFTLFGLALLFAGWSDKFQPVVAIVLGLGPGLVMLETGVRVLLGRPRADGAYVHPAVRVTIGLLFLLIAIFGAVDGFTRGALTFRTALRIVGYVATGVMIVRGRLFGREPSARNS